MDLFDKVMFELQAEDSGATDRIVKSKKADRYDAEELGTDSENIIVTTTDFEHAEKVAKAYGLRTRITGRSIIIYIPQNKLINHYKKAGGKTRTKKQRVVIQGKKITPTVNS